MAQGVNTSVPEGHPPDSFRKMDLKQNINIKELLNLKEIP